MSWVLDRSVHSPPAPRKLLLEFQIQPTHRVNIDTPGTAESTFPAKSARDLGTGTKGPDRGAVDLG